MTTTDNALHAAEIWLQRMGADPAATAVVTAQPNTALGIWEPGAPNIVMLARIDDAGTELCEALAPAMQEALGQLNEDKSLAVMAGVNSGGMRVQALLMPSTGEIEIRLVGAGKCFPLASIARNEIEH